MFFYGDVLHTYVCVVCTRRKTLQAAQEMAKTVWDFAHINVNNGGPQMVYKFIVVTFLSVSYTHLDVYKRQV